MLAITKLTEEGVERTYWFDWWLVQSRTDWQLFVISLGREDISGCAK
jgi:hypothetical protein